MCGHVGVAGTMRLKDEQAFRDLLTVDVIRGPHSTGICAVSNFKGVDLVKKPLLPTDMFTLKAVEDMFYRANYLFMGHNRWATQGAINAVNAHPFQFDTLVGTHNGTLKTQRFLPDFQDFEVDSENVFHSIQKLGVAETWKILHGAASLVWYDIENKKINFLRNSERPMYITFVNDRKAMFYASEAWMLEGVLKKNGIEYTDIFDTVVDTHYSMDIPNAQEVFDKTQSKILTPYKEPVYHYPKRETPPQKSGNVIMMGSRQEDTTATETTDGGVYSIGDEVYFRLDEIPTELGKNAHAYIWGTEQAAGQRVKVYTQRNSWLRNNIFESDDGDDMLYVGTMNGYGGANYICLQENSIFSVDEEQEEQGAAFDDDVAEAEGNIDEKFIDVNTGEVWDTDVRERMVEVIGKSFGCAWCASPMFASPHHVIIDDRTIICKDCKHQEDVKDYLIATN